MARRPQAPSKKHPPRDRRVAELEREIRTALDSARPVLSSGILGGLLAEMIEQHRKGKPRK
jgi:hypothetical protein